MSGARVLVVAEKFPPYRKFSFDVFVHEEGGDALAIEVFEKLGYDAWTEGGPRAD